MNEANRYAKVTRFEVIDHTRSGVGRILTRYGVSVDLALQDDDRTLKVFLAEPTGMIYEYRAEGRERLSGEWSDWHAVGSLSLRWDVPANAEKEAAEWVDRFIPDNRRFVQTRITRAVKQVWEPVDDD